ncbi:IS200/IS605 family transposase [Photobacterium carnosum]|uniref:IS200/IS605 family transposase n=1 Tax=Photobacterium carnosum TaxID=2023717 RepID=UPI001E41D2F4|nr:IS200/IS605 family transposase [Photobacterium carnosum]
MVNMYEWRIGRKCLFNNNVHLVFVTKYRRGVFTKDMLDRTKEIMEETCKQMDCELLEFGGEHDHVHLMVSIHPKVAVSNLVSKLKGKSSYMLRREYWERIKTMLWGNHFWSPSYCVVSCGGASLDVVKQYIENQSAPPSERAIKTSRALSHKKD